ncbi:hypothetical protein ANCDUO_26351, partial [Ancylostoma duodenale]
MLAEYFWEGDFYSAEDADSCRHPSQLKRRKVEELLKDQKIGDHDAAEVFCEYFNIEKDGNDPHGELQNQNVLRMKRFHDYYPYRCPLRRHKQGQ